MMVHKKNCCGNFIFRSEYTYYASYGKNNPRCWFQLETLGMHRWVKLLDCMKLLTISYKFCNQDTATITSRTIIHHNFYCVYEKVIY